MGDACTEMRWCEPKLTHLQWDKEERPVSSEIQSQQYNDRQLSKSRWDAYIFHKREKWVKKDIEISGLADKVNSVNNNYYNHYYYYCCYITVLLLKALVT